MAWWYLSPHLDDAVYSCGGLIAEQVRAGEAVHILSICAGDPPDAHFSPFAQALHTRWGTDGFATVAQRRHEDQAACALLGLSWLHADIPDCIYRRDPAGNFLYQSEEALFGEIQPPEEALIARLRQYLRQHIPPQDQVVLPLGLGNHVDHQLVRRAAQGLDSPLWYYADYPYARSASAREVIARVPEKARLQRFPLPARAVQAWVAGIAAYASQLHTFWQDETALAAEMHAWSKALGGAVLWQA